MPEVYLVSTGQTSIAAATWNPYLKTTGDTEVIESALPASPRAQLGTAAQTTVSSTLTDQLHKIGGAEIFEAVKITVDGTDFTESLKGSISYTWAGEDKVRRISIRMSAASFNTALHAKCNPGKVVVLYHVLSPPGSLPVELAFFRGITQEPDTDEETNDTVIPVVSMEAVLDWMEVFDTFRLDGLPYGCVVDGYGGEGVLTASGGTLTMQSVRVAIDTSSIGKQGGYQGSQGGRYYQGRNGSGSWGWPPNMGDEERDGEDPQIAFIDLPTTTLTLSAQPNLTLDDEDLLGMKYAYVTQGGVFQVSDDPPPVGAVQMGQWEQLYPGMVPLTADLVDTRQLTLEEGRRNRKGLIQALLENHSAALAFWGIDVAATRYPGENNDPMTGTVSCSGNSLASVLDDLCRGGRWRWFVDAESGNLVFTIERVDRVAVPAWEYTRDHVEGWDLMLPKMGRITGGGLTVLGEWRKNLGRVERTEVRIKRSYGPDPTGPTATGTGLAGAYQPYNTRNDQTKLQTETTETATFIGNTLIRRERVTKKRRNPLNFPGIVQANRDVALPMTSPEGGVDYLYDRYRMMKAAEELWEGRFEGGVFTGYTLTKKEILNPINHDPATAYRYGAPMGYGWLYTDERLVIVSIEEFKITPTSFGFVGQTFFRAFALANPAVNYEGGWGSGGQAVGTQFAPAEELIKTLEETTDFKRIDYETVEIDRERIAFVKRPGANAHGTGMSGGTSNMGHTSTIVGSKEQDHERKRGTLDPITGLEDEIKVMRVGARYISPTVAGDYGSERLQTVEYPYLFSATECERVLAREWADRLGPRVKLTGVPWNSRLRPHQTVHALLDKEGRLLDQLGIVTVVSANIDCEQKQASTMDVEVKLDPYAMAAFLAGRT